MNETYTTLVGNLVADPVVVNNGAARPVTRFRIAVTERTFNPDLGKTVDGRTSFYQVSVWGYLGLNAAESLQKGQRVIVYGKLAIEQYQTKDGQLRTSAGVEARALGHDLTFGGTRFRKMTHTDVEAGPEPADHRPSPDENHLVSDLPEDECEPEFDPGDGEGSEVPPYQEVNGVLVDHYGQLASTG